MATPRSGLKLKEISGDNLLDQTLIKKHSETPLQIS